MMEKRGGEEGARREKKKIKMKDREKERVCE